MGYESGREYLVVSCSIDYLNDVYDFLWDENVFFLEGVNGVFLMTELSKAQYETIKSRTVDHDATNPLFIGISINREVRIS